MTTAYVTSFNHASLAGVEEIVSLLEGELRRCGFNAISCRTLPAEINDDDLLIVVDEFSEPLVLGAFASFRAAHPKTTFVCVLTEFFASGTWAHPPSLNSFKHPWQSLLFDNLLYSYCFLSKKLALFPGTQIRAPGIVNYTLGLAGLVWLALQKAWQPRTPLRRLHVFHERAYLWFRALGLQSISGIFDFYLALHPAIGNKALATALGTSPEQIHTFLVPPPVVDKSELVNKKLEFGIDLSGSATYYRNIQMKRIMRHLHHLSPGGRFAQGLIRGFNDSKKKFLLSFNPPQSRTWRYSSPMRIIGAVKRGQIPVVSEKFGDHPAEDLALLFPEDSAEMKSLVSVLAFERIEYINLAWEKLENYRKIADNCNREIIGRLRVPRNQNRPT
jgi:hypothetical protein